VIIFALSSEYANKMCEMFLSSKVTKRYLAVVRGYFPEFIDLDYGLKEEKWKQPQQAHTTFTLLDKCELPVSCGKYDTTRVSLVEAKPHTGRKHQIRKHLKHLFHPVIGDTTYGDGKYNRVFKTEFNNSSLFLCAYELNFFHPFKEGNIKVKSIFSEDFKTILKLFKWIDL
jgi:tRNA pseudouridine65 synthase